MLQESVWWWARQMRGLLPLEMLPEANHGSLVIDAKPQHVTLIWRRRGEDSHIGQLEADGAALAAAVHSLPRRPRRVVLGVEPNLLLERQLELPLAAERELDRVLSYEMDRFTPFTASEVVWQAIVTRRDHAQRRLLLRLALVPRRALQPLLEMMAKAGLRADWLHATAPDRTLRRFALGSEALRHSSRRGITVLAGATAVLAVATIVTPFLMQAFARSATDRAIATLAPRVAKVEALRKHLAEGAGGADVLTAERARTGDVLQVLAALTELIPDGT